MLARILAVVGRTMITAGVLTLLFVAYQLWGTGIHTARAQDDLDESFAAALEEANGAIVSTTTTSTTSSTSSTSTVPQSPSTTRRRPPTTAPPLPPQLLPRLGEVAGRIVIPSIGVDYKFVEGVGVADLKNGPGHYPHSPLPGQSGNASIAGHRTTYGAPFHDVDQLQRGDEIHITTVQGEFTYEVRATEIVSPDQVEVLDPDHWDFDGDGRPEENVLTLTACHPKYSARERIIIGAELVGEPAPPTPRPEADPVADERDEGDRAQRDDEEEEVEVALDPTLSGEEAGNGPAVAWGATCSAIWLVAWAIGRRWRRLKWPSYATLVLPFGVALFFFFEEFSRLLPANY